MKQASNGDPVERKNTGEEPDDTLSFFTQPPSSYGEYLFMHLRGTEAATATA